MALDAGYEDAIEEAKKYNLNVPMLDSAPRRQLTLCTHLAHVKRVFLNLRKKSAHLLDAFVLGVVECAPSQGQSATKAKESHLGCQPNLRYFACQFIAQGLVG